MVVVIMVMVVSFFNDVIFVRVLISCLVVDFFKSFDGVVFVGCRIYEKYKIFYEMYYK